MTPPERIAVQQSYNLLTAISPGGVRAQQTNKLECNDRKIEEKLRYKITKIT